MVSLFVNPAPSIWRKLFGNGGSDPGPIVPSIVSVAIAVRIATLRIPFPASRSPCTLFLARALPLMERIE